MNAEHISNGLSADFTLKKWRSAQELVDYPGIPGTDRRIRDWLLTNSVPSRKRTGSKGREYDPNHLPKETQIALYLTELKEGEVVLDAEMLHTLDRELITEEGFQKLHKKGRKPKLPPQPLRDDQRESLHSLFEKSTAWTQSEARKRLEVVRAYYGLLPLEISETERKATIEERYTVPHATLDRWLKLIKGQDTSDWLVLLAPRKKGNGKVIEFTPEAWAFIKEEWGTLSRPTIRSVFERATRIAPSKNWSMPGYDTIKRRIGKLPKWWKVLRRNGPQALAHLYPAQARDYLTMTVHDLWESDGHKLDVFCRWPDGTIGRPILLVWRDVRTRMVLGWAIGKTESSYLISLAFRKAMEYSKAVPREALMDNGRGYASKLLTGGAKTRFRFKIKEDDPVGTLIMLGVNPVWAEPYHGQSKPVESFFRTIVNYVSKHSDFTGAYCGNKPDAKPENFDPKKAVPIEDVERRLEIEFKRYHEREHRGQGMSRQSPRKVYETLIQTAVIRTPTQLQLRLCLMKAIKLSLSAKEHNVTVLGNRYWSEELAELPNRGPYDIRFDPGDASVPVSVYDGERYLCDASLVAATGFRNQEAAGEHSRGRRKFVKAKKDQDMAAKTMVDAKRWEREAEPEQPETPPVLPVPAVAEMVHPKFNLDKAPEPPQDDFDEDEFDRLVGIGVWGSTSGQ